GILRRSGRGDQKETAQRCEETQNGRPATHRITPCLRDTQRLRFAEGLPATGRVLYVGWSIRTSCGARVSGRMLRRRALYSCSRGVSTIADGAGAGTVYGYGLRTGVTYEESDCDVLPACRAR